MISNKKILVIEEIEDDDVIRDVLKDKFNQEGFSVLQAKDGEEGLAIALSEHPDLILLDIVMPKMDGLTVMKKLRQTNGWSKNVPIILLTDLEVDEGNINQAVADNNPTYYLVKSNFTPNELVEKVKEFLSQITK